MNLWLHAGAILLGSSMAMALVWAHAMSVRNVGYVDVAWAGLMGLAAIYAALVSDGSLTARLAVGVAGGLWGLRLFAYLFRRVHGEPEDGRYLALRTAWNGSPAKFFVFFQLQAVIVALFSLPFLAAATNADLAVWPWLALAAVVWLLSVGGETLADRQLAQFRAAPGNRGKTCRAGLWGWSRHPNYFFEWLHWFTYVLLAVGAPNFWLSLLGPVVMLLFLYRVSGIPWTEMQALRSRGEDYARYQREVSAFFPWPPRGRSTEPSP